MCCGSGSCGGRCLVCKIVAVLVALVLTLTTLASFVGVWRTHMMPTGGWVFGTPDGSLALLVFIISLAAWFKVVKKICPCRSSKMCGCGGACAKCGDMPCTCKK